MYMNNLIICIIYFWLWNIFCISLKIWTMPLSLLNIFVFHWHQNFSLRHRRDLKPRWLVVTGTIFSHASHNLCVLTVFLSGIFTGPCFVKMENVVVCGHYNILIHHQLFRFSVLLEHSISDIGKISHLF